MSYYVEKGTSLIEWNAPFLSLPLQPPFLDNLLADNQLWKRNWKTATNAEKPLEYWLFSVCHYYTVTAHLRNKIDQRYEGQRRQHKIPNSAPSSRPPRPYHVGNNRALLRQERHEAAQRHHGWVWNLNNAKWYSNNPSYYSDYVCINVDFQNE